MEESCPWVTMIISMIVLHLVKFALRKPQTQVNMDCIEHQFTTPPILPMELRI